MNQPHCPSCQREMMLIGVEPLVGKRPQYERRRYECRDCDLRELHVGEHAGGTLLGVRTQLNEYCPSNRMGKRDKKMNSALMGTGEKP
jgi:hypothetical protein